MTCKWAEEGQLSAYLDGTLDPTARAEVESHVEHCAECTGMLAEFRYFDGLLRDLPRFEPSEHLRSRIFDSPQFADILRSLERDGAAATARGPVFSRPRMRRSGPPAGHDRPLEPLPVPAPASPSPTPSGVGRRHGSAPPWVRVAASVAAALVLLAGSALLVKQGLSHSSSVGQQSISGISKFQNPKPLAAGPRVVYLHDGALWSAPEQGSGSAQQLTPPGVVVGDGWAVSPQRDSIAYIDEAT
ncbi:MAG TPA: anti-sigma factor, partial [Ktedonobacterales bacterium]|nr:anti-sigma factor [Ktedonobacterales bacterium]